jgi:DNA polymerase (family X)
MAGADGKLPLARAYEIGGMLLELLRQAGAREARMVGEVRRGHAFVSEIEILVRGLSPTALADTLTSVSRCQRRGPASGIERLVLPEGGHLQVRAVSDGDWLAALIEQTGDSAHAAWLHDLAQAAGWSWQELAKHAQSEANLYELLGLAPVPPELRRGAGGDPVDELVTTADIRGIFHCHTSWSDGRADLVETIRAAEAMGFSYIGISDHSRSDANGLDEARLYEQRAAIARAWREVEGIVVLHGVEVDILEDGSLDVADEALAELDFVIASIHSHQKLSTERMTERIVKALHHPLVTFFGHPTGRYRQYDGYQFDLDAVCSAAINNDVCFEVNGSPRRLDPSGSILEAMASRCVRFVINPDAHAPWGVGDTYLGVTLARNAGIARRQVLNAGTPDKVLGWLSCRRTKAIKRLGLSAVAARKISPNP